MFLSNDFMTSFAPCIITKLHNILYESIQNDNDNGEQQSLAQPPNIKCFWKSVMTECHLVYIFDGVDLVIKHLVVAIEPVG